MRTLKTFAACVAVMILEALAFNAMAQTLFISGLEGGFVFTAAQCGSAGKTLTFSSYGKAFKVLTFYYGNSAVTAVEDASGERTVLFIDGKPNMATSSGKTYPKIGFNGGNELKTNEYAVGPHDFTDDGEMELVVGVRSASGNGTAIYVFGLTAGGWKCLGEMVSSGREIRFSKVFRQTVTMKDAASGVLFTWTWHSSHFDFLSSDHKNNPDLLY